MAVIDALSVRFRPGFTAVTGETGAGKSLLIQALGLVAGGRATAEAVRSGADRCLIEAGVLLQNPGALARLHDEGYFEAAPAAPAEVLVRRLIQADGQHRVYLNGRLATVQLLQEVIAPELEILAQHAQQRLLLPEIQLQLLDRVAGLEAEREAMTGHWERLRDCESRIAELDAAAGNRERELDWLRFQLREFEEVDPGPDEHAELAAELARLEGGAARAEAAVAAVELLAEGEACALDRLFSAEDLLRRAGRLAPDLDPLTGRVAALAQELRELVRELGRLQGDEGPETTAALRTRLDQLERLMRKHGGDWNGMLAERERLAASLADLEQLDRRREELVGESATLRADYDAAARQLSEARRRAAESLAVEVDTGLARLDMPHARFSIGGWGEARPGPTGTDRVEFLLAANPGEPARPVRKVASGGELSRILLAVQGAIGVEIEGATVVFDEIDTGIGGETALVVGRRMRELGRHAQVLAVTHTPQVAAAAHQQLHLGKSVADGRARTELHELDEAARPAEIARMLGSRDNETAREHAKALLGDARKNG